MMSLPHETLDLFADAGGVGRRADLSSEAVQSRLEVRGPAVEQERVELSEENKPGSIGWYAAKQIEYWNKAFPWAKK
jgi:hypothetical protein